MIYLDYNATTPVREQAVQAWNAVNFPANPSSVHGYGRNARKIVEDARAILADALSCFAEEIIFTASGTEANNMVLQGFSGRKLFLDATAHPSIAFMVSNSSNILVNQSGILQLEKLRRELEATPKNTSLISVLLANNETGIIQPISELANLAQEFGALLHLDATQAFGKIPLDMGILGADLLTISAHKMGGVVGAAALIVRQNINIHPLLRGGGQERRLRAGTENVPAIAAFAAAAKQSREDNWQANLRERLNQMEARIEEKYPQAIIVGKNQLRLPNTSNIILPPVSAQTQLMYLDINQIAVSAGSACSSGKTAASQVLLAMGYTEKQASCAIRISGGWATQESELAEFERVYLGKGWV